MGLKPATNPDVEATSIELSIDGKTVTAKDGVSLYDVISMTGKIIPAMCYHYTFDPFGSCGMCLVMQEGKKAPVRSCTAKAAAGRAASPTPYRKTLRFSRGRAGTTAAGATGI